MSRNNTVSRPLEVPPIKGCNYGRCKPISLQYPAKNEQKVRINAKTSVICLFFVVTVSDCATLGVAGLRITATLSKIKSKRRKELYKVSKTARSRRKVV